MNNETTAERAPWNKPVVRKLSAGAGSEGGLDNEVVEATPASNGLAPAS